MNLIKITTLIFLVGNFSCYGMTNPTNVEQTTINRDNLKDTLKVLANNCGAATKEETLALAEFLRNNPDIKNEASYYIGETINITQIIGKNYAQACTQDAITGLLYNFDPARDAFLSRAQQTLIWAENCNFLHKELQKLMEEN